MTNKQIAEKAIRRLCEDLQELSFGCHISVPQNSGEMYCFNVVDVMESNSYQDINPQTFDGKVLHEDVEKIVLARNCAITDDELDRFASKDIEIIGHPIHLEHVLKALITSDTTFEVTGSSLAGVYISNERADDDRNCQYRLKPFSEQPESVYQFLADILEDKSK